MGLFSPKTVIKGEKMTDNFEIRSGRTENRGNWVEVKSKDITIKIIDDKKHPMSQERMRNICINTINKIKQVV